jgi:uncharacterized alpha/beta hydrolase family protein
VAKMKRLFLFSFMAIVFSVILVGCGNKTEVGSVNKTQLTSELKLSKTNEESNSSSEVPESSSAGQDDRPTLFIHGYGGTFYTFSRMLARFEEANYGEKLLTIDVEPDGSISESGTWQDGSPNPFIQVIFADKNNNEWNQADWIKAVLVYLKTTYQIDEVNLVGHSMGGVSSLKYLVVYGNEATQPVVKHFVALGSPFNDLVEGNENLTIKELHQNGPLVLSGRYNEYSVAIRQYPASIKMLNIVGDIGDGSKSDGTVSVNSGLSIGYLMETNNFDYREHLITGKYSSHTKLHENRQVDKLIAEFLWDN